MTPLPASKVRIPSAAFNSVAFEGKRIRVRRRDKVGVVAVSEEDAAFLQAVEDYSWGKLAHEALAQAKSRRQKPIPWKQLRARLGL